MLNLTQEVFLINRFQKEQLNKHSSFVLWFTGLSASGKSTIASRVEEALFTKGIHTVILDGDNTRLGLNKDLGFSAKDRKENIRRVAEISKLMNDAGVVVLASFISPFEEDRAMAKTIIGEESFIEIFIDASLDTCRLRDPKGLYQLADHGKIKDFTGLDSPYERPQCPAIHLNTNHGSAEDAVEFILEFLIKNQKLMHLNPAN